MRDHELRPDPGPALRSPTASSARTGTADQVPFHCMSV
jgi:hypothetical protein